MSDNIPLLQSLYEAFGRGDIASILKHLTDDVTWGTDSVAQEVPWYRIRRGPAEVGDFFATLDREVEFTEFQPKLFTGTADEVIVCVEIGYRLKKNGRTASTGSVHRFKVRNGKVARFRAFEDTAAVRDAWNS